MAFSKARAAREKEELKEEKSVQRYLDLKIIQPGDAVNFCRPGDSVCL